MAGIGSEGLLVFNIKIIGIEFWSLKKLGLIIDYLTVYKGIYVDNDVCRLRELVGKVSWCEDELYTLLEAIWVPIPVLSQNK